MVTWQVEYYESGQIRDGSRFVADDSFLVEGSFFDSIRTCLPAFEKSRHAIFAVPFRAFL